MKENKHSLYAKSIKRAGIKFVGLDVPGEPFKKIKFVQTLPLYKNLSQADTLSCLHLTREVDCVKKKAAFLP